MVVKLLISFLFLCALCGYGQNITVTGTLLDKDNGSIAYANIILHDENASIVSGTISEDNGFFTLKNVKPGSYLMIISYLGFKSYKKTMLLAKDVNLEPIILEDLTEELEGVTIVAKRPTIKRLVDRLVFNVENSTLSDNNVLDILKYTPGVMINDDKIMVKNGVPTVYINDKRIHLSSTEVLQLLEGTSASNIKSIEVITNPPAKYEAEGGAVLNIITKKNLITGYNGTVFGNYKYGSKYAKYAFGTSHFFKTKKLNTYFNYSISPKKDYKNNTEYINFIDNNDDLVSSWETNYNKTIEASNHNISASIDFDLDKKNTISLSTNMLLQPRRNSKTDVNSLTEVYSPMGIIDSTFRTVNKSVNEGVNLGFTLDYIHKMDREGEKISSSVHYTNYDLSSFQNVETGYFFPNNIISFRDNFFETFSSQKIKLYTGQLDYELPINNSTQFEAGLKISKINSKSIIKQMVFNNDEKEEDTQNSDTFLYDEGNYAAYSSYSSETDTWSLKTGLRLEYTSITSQSLSINQENTQDYFKFFPSLHFLYKLNDKNTAYFQYNRRIYRPRYEELNPFKFFLNDNVYVQGDPKLKPQIDDVLTLGYTFNKKHTFELYYRFEKDPTLEIVFQDNNNTFLKYINTNIDTSISYGLDFTTYTQLANRWNLYLLSSLFYYENQFFALESGGVLEKNDKWSVYAEIVNYFTFLKDSSLTADVSFLYISPFADGPSIISDRLALDIHIRKTIWNNKGSISMGVTDIFNTQNYNQTTKYLNQDVFLKSRIENRLFTLGFNYKFGNTKLKRTVKETQSEERNRLQSKKDTN
ncbi:outer membrane beta-barrel protein [Mariniflexile ostreae]|uniref:Outer membrane beta-barrel protein n=1 Tax=Mariniflexile ostreae TaxID=1520892 RepID=A0ABV5FE94_9FLAO